MPSQQVLTKEAASRFLVAEQFDMVSSVNTAQYSALDSKAAGLIVRHKGDLDLSGLKSLSLESSSAIARHKNALDLSGLPTLSVEQATELARHRGDLNLWK